MINMEEEFHQLRSRVTDQEGWLPNLIWAMGDPMESMGKVATIALALAAVSFAERAAAEGNCPPGYYPQSGQGWQGCAPGPHAGGEMQAPRVVFDGYWQKTWGALAASATGANGSGASVSGLATKDEAAISALKQCRANGGGDGCEVNFVYFNQCVAVSGPIKDDLGRTFFRGGKDIETASRMVLADCSSKAGSQCEVVLTQCSEPIYHKY